MWGSAMRCHPRTWRQGMALPHIGMTPTAQKIDRQVKESIRDCLWITLAAAFIAVLLRPFQNVPFVDDWAYAWPVEHLLQTGEMRILDWSTSINVAQVLWGALFSIPFGFSFTALRISTFVLAIGGLCGFYLLLRELSTNRAQRTAAAAVLGLN